MRSPSPVRCWLLLIWLCFVVRGSFYAAALPLWEGFDEYSHYARIELLATEGRDPPRTAAVPADVADSLSRVPAKNGGMTFDEFWTLPAQQRQRPYPAASATVYEAQQPPLFYWLAAAIYKLTPGISMASHVLVIRLFCLLSASLCIPFGYLIALRVLPTSNLALQATLLIAAMPVSTFTATHVANEGLAIALGTIVVWAALEGRSIALLFAFGAALLTKAYFLAFLAPLGSLLYLRARTAKALAGSLLLAGWWYWNTWRTTGSLTGNVILVHPQLSEMLRTIFHFPVLSAAGFAWMTFLWTGNWSLLIIRGWMYKTVACCCLLSLAGVAMLIARRNPPILLLSGFVFWFAAAIAYFAVGSLVASGYHGAFGWYACCVLAPIAILLFAGMHHLLPRAKSAAGPIFVLMFSAVELFATHIYMWPYYTGFIAHLPNGGMPAFRPASLDLAGLLLMFERLTLFKPDWVSPPALLAGWLSFLLATVSLAAVSLYFAVSSPEQKS